MKGHPAVFRCSECRSYRAPIRAWPAGSIQRVDLTGKTRRNPSRSRGHWSDLQREYECADCGHTGWSSHPDLARKEEK